MSEIVIPYEVYLKFEARFEELLETEKQKELTQEEKETLSFLKSLFVSVPKFRSVFFD